MFNTNKKQKCLIKGEVYGESLSIKLAFLLRTHTNISDIKEASELSKMSVSTFNSLIYRSGSLKERNANALKILMRVAIKNSDEKIRSYERAIKEFTPLAR